MLAFFALFQGTCSLSCETEYLDELINDGQVIY